MPMKPKKIDEFTTGLVQERVDFALKDDAFTILQNAWVFREKVVRKRGTSYLGRLRRCLGSATTSYFDSGADPWSFNIKKITGYISNIDITGSPTLVITTPYAHGLTTGDSVVISGVVGTTDVNGNTYSITVTSTTTFTVNQASVNSYTSGGFWFSNRASTETESSIEPGSLTIIINGVTVTDQGDGTLTGTGITGTIKYFTGDITITGHTASSSTTLEYCYFPSLPTMGICERELSEVNDEQTLIFDTKYCYRYNTSTRKFQEFESSTPTIWTGSDYNFFYSANYWNTSTAAQQSLLFWVTNGTDQTGDPIRYYDPIAGTWKDFGQSGSIGLVDATNYINQAQIIVPFRSRLLMFGTYEGTTLATSVYYPNRIRWCQIGNPIAVDSWRSDIRGKGGFIDLPTNQKITGVDFVRDNLIIYCDRSTRKLRYTGQAIAPFAPEKVNTELGVESAFSTVNFDTSNMGIGDKGVINTDSYKAERIDYKIPDLVYTISNENQGTTRVHGLRDFETRTAYWTYCDIENRNKFPNKRLLYNYENESWAIFQDSFTCLGVFQLDTALRWQDVEDTWEEIEYTWDQSTQALQPINIGGNQKGFISMLDTKLSNNDESLPIEDITLGSSVKTTLTIVNHNLETGQFITITGIQGSADYTSLNDNTYKIVETDIDTITLLQFDSSRGVYTSPFNIDPQGVNTYYGGGLVKVKDNFNIMTKKFHHLDIGKNTVFGWMDILCDTTFNGAFAMNVYVDYADLPANTQKTVPTNPSSLDSFFNTVISTATTTNEPLDTDKTFQKVNCNFRGRFVSLEFTFNESQMHGTESLSEVEINSMVLWLRPGGNIGF